MRGESPCSSRSRRRSREAGELGLEAFLFLGQLGIGGAGLVLDPFGEVGPLVVLDALPIGIPWGESGRGLFGLDAVEPGEQMLFFFAEGGECLGAREGLWAVLEVEARQGADGLLVVVPRRLLKSQHTLPAHLADE